LNGIKEGHGKIDSWSWCTGNFLDNHLKIELNNNTSLIKVITVIEGAIGGAVSFDPQQVKMQMVLIFNGILLQQKSIN
jgi:hypothetical protein